MSEETKALAATPSATMESTAPGSAEEGTSAAGLGKEATPEAGSGKDAHAAAAGKPEEPAVTVMDGVLRNAAHGFDFIVPDGWTLKGKGTAEEMVFGSPSCSECILRLLVFPAEGVPAQETIQSLKKQIVESGDARVLDEQHIKVAREKGYTLVKEEVLPEQAPGKTGSDSAAADPPGEAGGRRILSRYVTFNHRDDKYYLVLRAPSERFGEDEDGLAKMLKTFRFESAE